MVGEIRKAELSDVPCLREIYNDAVLHTTATFDLEERSLEQMEDWYNEHQGKYCISVCVPLGEAGPIAYAALSRYRERPAFDGCVEISVYVHPDWRGKGIASSLMKWSLERAREDAGIHTVVSLITHENKASIKLHQKHGFSYCGQVKDAGYKFGRYVHLTVWQLMV